MTETFTHKSQGHDTQPMPSSKKLDDTSSYIERRLRPSYEIDTMGMARTVYKVGSRRVMFRNRLEKVELPKDDQYVIGAESVPPVMTTDVKGPSQTVPDVDAFNKQASTDHEQAILSIPATPRGLVDAAIYLGKAELTDVRDEMEAGSYTDAKAGVVVDALLAAVSIDDEGRALEYYDTNGYAVALQALLGDEVARGIIDKKLQTLYDNERDNRDAELARAKQHAEYYYGDIEPMPLSNLYALHSTEHSLEYDEDGSLLFAPMGAYRTDAPRSTWHMTINSNVAPHVYAGDSWSSINKIIVAPLSAIIDKNPNRLRNLNGVDSWVMMNPGEKIVIPSPTIISGRPDQEGLVLTSGNEVSVLAKQSYSEDEKLAIKKLADKYGASYSDRLLDDGEQSYLSLLREAATQQVLDEHGVEAGDRCQPSGDGRTMGSELLGRRINKTAAELGVGTGAHSGSPEEQLEERSMIYMDLLNHKLRGVDAQEYQARLINQVYDDVRGGYFTIASAPLSARRYAAVNGALPALDLASIKALRAESESDMSWL